MGGCNSLCIPTKNPNICRENHASLPKIRSSKRNLSTTFNFSDIQATHDMLNINTATEEEFMTLPGINRATAHNIIDYRHKIGVFKQVEDLALVSGVGAAKLESLRLEICVSKPKSHASKSSSPDGSVSGVEMSCIRKPSPPGGSSTQKTININTSNVFQLMKVKGIGLITAQNIVVYRDKKGPFRTVDDLLKVKGVGPSLLSVIRTEVCIDDVDDQKSNSDSGIGANATATIAQQRSTDSASNASDQVSQLVAMCGPLTELSTRPEVIPFTFEKDGRSVARIATWNVQQLTLDKINNPGVKEVICMTILERGFGIIAFQEIAKKEALQKICDELNNPTLPSVSKWRGPRGLWECIVSNRPTGRMFQGVEYTGFLFDTEQEISCLSSALIETPPDGERKFVRKPFVGHFKVHAMDVVLCSVHLKAPGLRDEDLDDSKNECLTVHKIAQTVSANLKNEKDIIILGDFNMAPESQEFEEFKTKGYSHLIPANVYTNISTKNMQGSQAYDNIWASKTLNKHFTGQYEVVRTGLTNPWIPDGWSWGGVVSDHCPLYVEFFVDIDSDKGDHIKLETLQLVATAHGGTSGFNEP